MVSNRIKFICCQGVVAIPAMQNIFFKFYIKHRDSEDFLCNGKVG